MDDKTSSTSMALIKNHPMLDENEKRPVKSITEEEKKEAEEEELKSSSIKMTISLPSDQKTKSAGVGESVSHCSHHGKTSISEDKEHVHCDECKGSLEPVASSAVDHGDHPKKEYKAMMKGRMSVFRSCESGLPRFYAAQAAASKSNAEQVESQQASPASKERQKYLKDKGLRVRFSEEISYRSPSPSKHEDEDEDDGVEDIGLGLGLARARGRGRGQKTPEEFDASDEDNITEYIAWSNSIKNKYGNASPGTFDFFRVTNAGTLSTSAGSSSIDGSHERQDLGWAKKLGLPPRKQLASPSPPDYSKMKKAAGDSSLPDGVQDPNDRGWAKKLGLPPRKQLASPSPPDYSKIQKLVARGSFSLDGADDPNDHACAQMLSLPPRKQLASPNPPDYSKIQKAVARGSFSLDGADDPLDRGWAKMLGLPTRKQTGTSAFERSRLQIVDAVSAARSWSPLDGGKDHHDRGWAQKLGLRPRKQHEQYEGSHYYMVPTPDQTVNDDQPKRLDPAYLEHLEQTSEYHKAISDVHHVTQRRLEQPQPQLQPQRQPEPQPMWSKNSIKAPFSFLKRDQHSRALLNAPDVVRSPVQGPSQGPAHGPFQGPFQGHSQGHSQGYGASHHRAQSALPARPGLGQDNAPGPSHGTVQTPVGLSRGGGSRHRENAQPHQPYVNNQGPPQFISPSRHPMDTTVRHVNVPMLGPVRSLGVINKADLGPEYRPPPPGFGQYPAAGGQYPAVAFGQYPGMGPGPHPGMGPGPHPGMGPGQFPGMRPGPHPSMGPQHPAVPVPYQYYPGAVPAPAPYPFMQGAGPAHNYPAPPFGQYPAGPVQNGPGTAAPGGFSQVPAPFPYYPAAESSAQAGHEQSHPGVAPRALPQGGPVQRSPPAAAPAFTHSTPAQRHHPSATLPGELTQAAPVELYNSPGGSGGFGQDTSVANHPSATAGGGLARAATQKALPPTPTSQRSSQSNVSPSNTRTDFLPATRYSGNANPNHYAHRRSSSTAHGQSQSQSHGQSQSQSHGQGRPTSVQSNAAPHFFRPDFITMDPINVQGHGRDVVMRDARFFVNRDRDVSLQNMVANRTAATTGQNPLSRDEVPVRPRGGPGGDRWASQNLEPSEERMIASVMRQPVLKAKGGKSGNQ